MTWAGPSPARAAVLALAIAALGETACSAGARAPSCAAAAGRVAHGMREVHPELERASVDPTGEVESLCRTDRWSRIVIECYASADTPVRLRECSDRLGVVQRTHARDLQDRLYQQADQSRAGAGEADTGIRECDRYVAALNELTSCDKVPPAVVEAMHDALAVMRQTWRDAGQLRGGDRTRAREAAARGCETAEEAVRQTAAALGC